MSVLIIINNDNKISINKRRCNKLVISVLIMIINNNNNTNNNPSYSY